MAYTVGQKAPVSGVYRVLHDRNHRQPHEITMIAGRVFPPCEHCGQRVTYDLVRRTEHLSR
jgi:hypothetical protein